MKALESDLLREILADKESRENLRRCLNNFYNGDLDTTFTYKNKIYTVTTVRPK